MKKRQIQTQLCKEGSQIFLVSNYTKNNQNDAIENTVAAAK